MAVSRDSVTAYSVHNEKLITWKLYGMLIMAGSTKGGGDPVEAETPRVQCIAIRMNNCGTQKFTEDERCEPRVGSRSTVRYCVLTRGRSLIMMVTLMHNALLYNYQQKYNL